MATARQQSGTQREAFRRSAEELVRRTTAIRLPDGATLRFSDTALADRLARGDLDGALTGLDAAIGWADTAAHGYPGDRADGRLRELVQQQQARSSGLTVFAIARAIADRLFGWAPRPDLALLEPLLGAVGLGLAVTLAVLIARGSRERLRRETVLARARDGRREDPERHLREADRAARAGHVRDAVHGLYLYALAALAAREVLPADPALTDRELLTRAAASARVEELRELLRLHEHIWFGLREGATGDLARARALALRVVAG